MSSLEDKPGRSPGQLPKEPFGLVQTDRLIEAIGNSTFLLEPQKRRLEQLIRAIPEGLNLLPANTIPSVIIQRAEERDVAVSQNQHLWEENRNLRGQSDSLKREVQSLKLELSQKRESSRKQKKNIEDEEEISDGDIYERRILERIVDAYEGFVRDLGLALPEVVCKNGDLNGQELFCLVLERVLGIDSGTLSPLENREIDWLAKDLGLSEDHEVDLSAIEMLHADLERKLKEAREAPLEDFWPPLSAKSIEEEGTT